MLISQALAGHFTPDTGNSGGGDTLLIILGAGIVLGLLYSGQKRLRRRLQAKKRSRHEGPVKAAAEESPPS